MKKNTPTFATVMLIDDNEIDNFINLKMIEGCNFAGKVYVHTSGKSALEFLMNIDRNKDFPKELMPQVIFLDINMPIMDGFQFIDEFQKLKNIKDGALVMMLSSSINPMDHERSASVSAIAKFMHKPLTMDYLKSITPND